MGKIKEKLIEQYLKEPLKTGDRIQVMGLGSQDKSRWGNVADVEAIDIEGNPFIRIHSTLEKVEVEWRKWDGNIGTNPFPQDIDRVSGINFQLSSILHKIFREDEYDIEGIPVKSVNFNPFIFVDGEKKYYQRPLVWELKDKQLLIESIYNNVDCGKILVRQRGWEELGELQRGGHELAWLDVVDGKQRLNTVHKFMNDEFPDINGNYYSDFSKMAKHKFTEHQLFSYSELPEGIDDQYVIKQFLRLNFAGVPQSVEHIEYVKSLI